MDLMSAFCLFALHEMMYSYVMIGACSPWVLEPIIELKMIIYVGGYLSITFLG